MTPFELPAGTRLKLTKATPRKETHGKELVQAISLRLEWHPVENSMLNMLDPGLQDLFFWTPPEIAAQCELDGIPPVKKHLRSQAVAQPLKVAGSLSGYTLTIDHGLDDTTALELYNAALDKFEAEAKMGGSCTIRWSLASNKEITPELVGALCSLEGGEIVAQLTAPTAEQVIDGTTAAFQAAHPDAPDLCAAGAETDGDPEGAADVPEDAADDEGASTDVEQGDAAAFEAGAAAAIGKAKTSRRGRRAAGAVS